MAFETVSPVGRIVQGNPLVGQQRKDDNGNPLFNADGSPTLQYYVGLAISKQDPAAQQLIAQINAEAQAAWPNLFDPATGACRDPKFSIKYLDGDGFDANGKSYAEREGMAGHWVLRLQSNYPLRSYNGMDGRNTEITDPEQIYRGCFAVAAIEVKSNNATGTHTRGLYINCRGLQMVGHGERILGGANPDELFGGAGPAIAAGAYVPPGMTQTPPAPAAVPAAMVPPAAPAAPAPQPLAPPNTAFVQHALTGQAPAPAAPAPAMAPPPPAPAMAPPPPAPAAPQYALTPAGQAQGFTIDQWLAAGYDHAALIAAGTIVAV